MRSENAPKTRTGTLVPGIVPVRDMKGGDDQDVALLQRMLEDARSYLRSFSWCDSIEDEYFGGGAGGIFAIFLFNISTSRPEVDPWMWIVVGDIPSSYLPLEDCKSPLEVFETYVDGMTRWTRLARKGQTGTADEGIPPVNVPPTPEWAEKLKSRLQALKEVVRPFFEQDQASSHLSGFHGLCETWDSVMTAQTRKKSPFTLVAFVALLMIAAGSAVYAFLHSGPWIVPEEAKRMVNPLKQWQANLPAARRLYEDKCAECHGDTGKGDGAQGKMYNPQPQDLTDAAHMNAISDGELFYKISEGHRPMPAFRKRLTDEQRWHLVLLIRSFSAATKQQ